jgi:glucose/arabinose dehydrogenase
MYVLPFIRRPELRRIGLVASALAIGACADDRVTAIDPPLTPSLSEAKETAITCLPDNAGLTLPAGFCAVVVAEHIGLARHMAIKPNGDLYVALNNNPNLGIVGGVMALRDNNGDGYAEQQQKFGTTGGNGIVWRENQLWFAQNDRVVRYALPLTSFTPSAAPVTIVGSLPDAGDHVSKTIVIRFGTMYLNVGSASNSCQVADRQDFSPGIDPCPELPIRAGVWRYSANTVGQVHSTANRFAIGTRNMVALAFNPGDGQIWGVQHGRDQLGDNWPNLFTPQDDFVLPAEEMFPILAGRDYGWPYCYYDGLQQKKVLAPEYGGDGNIVGRCATMQNPQAFFPAHWAPNGILFYTGSQFPSRYLNGAFIAFHGSRFNPLQQPAGPGYNVVFVPFSGGKPSGPYETFADGFAGPSTNLPTDARHRPVGLLQGPDGSLYISDDKRGFIYRIFYRGTGTT